MVGYIYERNEWNPCNSHGENCDKVLKFSHFWWGYLPCNVSSKQTDLLALNNFSSSIDKVSLKKHHVSGLVDLEENLFMRTRTPQSDAIISTD